MTADGDMMTAKEARDYLGISGRKMSLLIEAHTFTVKDDPLDKRVKLIPRAEVEALAQKSGRWGKDNPAAA